MNAPMKTIFLNSILIAPCGMNCGICLAYQRAKNTCGGCMGDPLHKPPYCLRCMIKNCEILAQTSSGFCYECPKYPCKRLKELDMRYRAKYRMSMIENLETIKSQGLQAFVDREKVRWRCTHCGATICVHRNSCLTCQKAFMD